MGGTENSAGPHAKVGGAQISQQVGVVGPGGTVIGVYQVVQQAPAAEPEPGDCPYKGLEAYDVQDAPLFFGREALTAELVRNLRDYPFLAVVGASGSGKSSVVRAGVVAAFQAGRELEGGVLPSLGSSAWPWRIVTPTTTPLEALARAVAEDGDAAAKLMTAMRADPAALRRTLATRLEGPAQRFLLVVDQFEELFVYGKDDKPQHLERQAFIDNLLAAAGVTVDGLDSGAETAPAVVILTLRADYYAACAAYDHLPSALASHQHYVTAMTRDELLRTVALPAQAGNWVFQQGLVEQILEDAGDEPGMLPLLSHALYQTWNNRSGRAMTLAGYRRAGGVQGAIATTAEAVYNDRLVREGAADERELARRIFLALVEPGPEGRATRRRAARDIFDPSGAGQAPEAAVLRKLSDPRARLVTVDQDWVQLAHEALIREWPRLGDWLRQYQGELELWDGIRDAAAAWAGEKDEGKRAELLVHKGGRLDDAVALQEKREYALTAREQAYVAACVAERDREIAAERQRQEERVRTAEQLAARQRQARQRLVAAGLIGVVALAAIVLATLFFGASKTAQTNESTARQAEATALVAKDQEALARGTAQANEAAAQAARATAEAAKADVERLTRIIRAGQLTAKGLTVLDVDPPLALLLGAEGLRAHYDVTYTQETGGKAVVLHEAVEASTEGDVHEMLRQLGGLLLAGYEAQAKSVAFSPDGRWLAAGWADGTARLWDVQDLAAGPTLLKGNASKVTTLAFSPDGRWLAAGSEDGTARLWDMQQPQAEPAALRGHTMGVAALAFSPDSRWFATGSWDETARIWAVQDLAARPVVLEGITRGASALAFSPDGRRLAIGSGDGSARLLDMRHPQAGPAMLQGHEDVIDAIAFSPDGHWLATGSDDGTARLWDAQELQSRPAVLQHDDMVTDLAFSPDGRWLATASTDNAARLWDVQHPQAQPAVLRGHTAPTTVLAFSPDGRWLATGSWDQTARLWDAQHPQAEPVVLRAHASYVTSLAFSTDGRRLATSSDDGTVRLWDLEHPQAEPVVLGVPRPSVTTLAFSPDGRRLAAGFDDGAARLWDVEHPQAGPAMLEGHKSADLEAPIPYVNAISFSPDGRWLAIGSWEETVRLWDVQHPQAEPGALQGHTGGVPDLAFSPDGRWLAAGCGDGTVRLWDVLDLAAGPTLLRGSTSKVAALGFSPNGRWLATGSDDGIARLWDMQHPQAEPALLRGHTMGIRALAFSADGRWLATGSYDNSARLWDVEHPGAEPAVLKGHQAYINALAFSPDGHWLATASDDGTARLWDVEHPRAEPAVLQAYKSAEVAGYKAYVTALAFSPDGRRLATGSWDDTARLWDVQQPQAEPAALQGHASGVVNLAFSPDGRWLAVGALDGLVRLWIMPTADLIDLACRSAGRNLTQQEWQQYLPDKPYRRTCEQWPAGK